MNNTETLKTEASKCMYENNYDMLVSILEELALSIDLELQLQLGIKKEIKDINRNYDEAESWYRASANHVNANVKDKLSNSIDKRKTNKNL